MKNSSNNRHCEARGNLFNNKIASFVNPPWADAMTHKLKILSLLVLILSLSSCFKYEDVQILEVTNIRVLDLTTKKIEIGIDMHIVNPNKYKISITDSDLELFIKNKKIGTAKIKDIIELPKKSDQVQHIAIVTDTKDIVSGAIPVLLSLMFDESIELQVKGEIRAKAKAISKNFPVDFKERVTLNK